MTNTFTLGQYFTNKNVEGTELTATLQQEIWEREQASTVAAAEMTLFVARIKSSLYKQVAAHHKKDPTAPLTLKVKVLNVGSIWAVLQQYVVEKTSRSAEVQAVLDSLQLWLNQEGLTMFVKSASSQDRVRDWYEFDFVPAA